MRTSNHATPRTFDAPFREGGGTNLLLHRSSVLVRTPNLQAQMLERASNGDEAAELNVFQDDVLAAPTPKRKGTEQRGDGGKKPVG